MNSYTNFFGEFFLMSFWFDLKTSNFSIISSGVSYILLHLAMKAWKSKNLLSTLVAETKPIASKNANKSFASPVLPENPGSYLKFKNNEEKLTVTVEIAPVVSEKSFSVETIDVKSLPKEFVVSSQKNSGILNLSGKLVDLEKFSVSQGSLFVNASEISEPGIYELDVKASVPAKFTVQDFSPKKIKVAVEKIKVVDELEEKVGDVITSPVNEILPEKIELTGGQSGE